MILAEIEITQADIDIGFKTSVIEKLKAKGLAADDWMSDHCIRIGTGRFDFDPTLRNYWKFNNLAKPCKMEVVSFLKMPLKIEGGDPIPRCGYINKVKES